MTEDRHRGPKPPRTVTCPECGSRDVRVLWRATDDDDLDSMACHTCDHRWCE